MANLLLHPFRVNVSGRIAAAAQGSDEYLDSQLRVIIGTRLGERDMCQPYGVPDPTFGSLTVSDIQTCADRYGPDDMTIVSVVNTVVDDTTVNSSVTWQRSATR